jgi:hypothetical protein
MNFKNIYKHDGQFLSITSLLPDEFDILYKAFKPRWLQWYKHYTFRQKRRRKPLTSKQMNSPTKTLPTTEDKLFFILYFFKVNPLQEIAAATFSMNQGQVSRWRKVLSPVLLQALSDLGFQAARNADDLIRLFRTRQRQAENDLKVGSLHLDATERPIERNLDYSTQKHDYSGKQGGHTAKNSIICDEYQFIHYVGSTWRGAVHDKSMIDMEQINLSAPIFDDLWFSQDSGYQGFRARGKLHHIEVSKAFRNKPLTAIQKEMNRWISPIRVVVENAIGGLKRIRMSSEKMRHFISDKADEVIAVAAGLHNFRVRHRKDGYVEPNPHVRAILQPFHS